MSLKGGKMCILDEYMRYMHKNAIKRWSKCPKKQVNTVNCAK